MDRISESALFSFFLLIVMVSLLGGSALVVARLGTNFGFLAVVAVGTLILIFFKGEYAIYLLIFSMLLSPEFGVGGLAGGGTSAGRGVTFRFDDFLLIIVALSWGVKSALYKELGILKRTPLNWAMFLYIFVCGVATLLGVSEGRVHLMTGSLFVIKYTQYFVLFFLVINNIDSDRQLRRYWVATLVTAVIVATISLTEVPAGGRVSAPFEGEHAEPNTFGGYLCFLIIMCVAMGISSRKYRQRFAYFAVAVYLLVPFLFTLSRASYLALIPGLAVVLFLTRNHATAYLLMSALLGLLIFPSLLPEAVRQRVTYTWTRKERKGPTLLGQHFDPSTSARLGSFAEVLRDSPKRPLLGYGVTGWKFIDSQYFRTLIETGLLGVGALFYLFFKLFQLGWWRFRRFRETSFHRAFAIGYLAGLVALLIHALGSNTFIIVRIMEPFWLVTGLLFAAESVAPAAEEAVAEPPLVRAA